MAMFTAYCDASGKKDRGGPMPAFFVAGWVSSVARWAKFEVAWPKFLAKYRLPPDFHMSSFMDRLRPGYKGPYAGWKGDEMAFRSAALLFVKRYTNQPLTTGVTLRNLRKMFRDYDVDPDEPREPFPWCGLHVCRLALWWEEAAKKRRKSVEMTLVFEDGDDDQKMLKKAVWKRFARDMTFETNNAKTFAPFAAADLLAWECRKWSENREWGWDTIARAKRATTLEERVRLAKSGARAIHPGRVMPNLTQHFPKNAIMYATEESLKEYCEHWGYPKRTKP